MSGKPFILAVVLWACGGASGAPPDCTGDERCACFENRTCNGGLECASDTCVRIDRGPDDTEGGGPSSGGQASPNGGMEGQEPAGGDANDAGSPVSSGGSSSGGSTNGGTPTEGGTPSEGGTPAQGGTLAQGGGPASGSGTGGSSGGGSPTSGGSPATGGVIGDPTLQCESGLRSGITACTEACTGSLCGLGDLGQRDCACLEQIYQCASCQFPSDPLLAEPAEPLPACPPEAVDQAYCEVDHERCMAGEEVCACLAYAWDCDDPPWLRLPCPAALPNTGDSCPATGLGACLFDGIYCSCDGVSWTCQ